MKPPAPWLGHWKLKTVLRWMEIWVYTWEGTQLLSIKGNYLVQLNVHFLMFLESFIISSTCFGLHSIHRQEHCYSFCSHRFFLVSGVFIPCDLYWCWPRHCITVSCRLKLAVIQWCGLTPIQVARNKHTRNQKPMAANTTVVLLTMDAVTSETCLANNKISKNIRKSTFSWTK
jgi:hypothetical protein